MLKERGRSLASPIRSTATSMIPIIPFASGLHHPSLNTTEACFDLLCLLNRPGQSLLYLDLISTGLGSCEESWSRSWFNRENFIAPGGMTCLWIDQFDATDWQPTCQKPWIMRIQFIATGVAEAVFNRDLINRKLT